MESIFQSVGTNRAEPANYSDGDDVTFSLRALIKDAEDYNLTDLAPAREKALRYYEGISPALDEPNGEEEFYDSTAGNDDTSNQSSVVSTDVRDTVLAIVPSLIRIFTSDENVVNFLPRDEQGDEGAKQQTDYINHVFWNDNDGFMILHDVIKDLLINKVGVVKWRTENSTEVKVRTFENITITQLSALLEEWSDAGGKAEIMELEPGEQGFVRSVVVRYTDIKPVHKVEAVPLDCFRVDRFAKNVKTARLIGEQSYKTPSDVVKRGVDKELVEKHLIDAPKFSEEAYMRNPGATMGAVYKVVAYGEYYIRYDSDDDGIDELHLVRTIGEDHEIIDDEIVDDVCMAVYRCDPRPHTLIGDSIADLTIDIQDINTQILRGSLDSLSKSMYSDLVVNETTTSVTDVMAGGVGKIIRTRTDPNSAVREFTHQFVGSSAFDMMTTMDGIRQRRTGISEASKGLDPKALQSTNLVGVNAIVSGAQERIELIALIIAHTGYKETFEGLLREVCRAPARARTIKLRGKWVDVDPSLFDAGLTAQVNPNMGKGSDTNRLMVLQDVKQTQLLIIEKFGISNPIVTPAHFMNTIKDIMAIGNVKNFSRYFGEITKELMDSIQNAPKEPSPEQLIAQAEMEKIKAQTAAAIAKRQTEERRTDLDEDFRRDKLTLDTLAKIATALAKTTTEDISSSIPMIRQENQVG